MTDSADLSNTVTEPIIDQDDTIHQPTPTQEPTNGEYQPLPFTVAPCFKSSLSHFFWVGVLVIGMIIGKSFLVSYYAASSLQETLPPAKFVLITNAFVIFVALIALSKIAIIFKNTANHRIVITPHHVEFVKGIANKRSTKINIAHIRTIDIEQTMAERMLDIGTVRIAASSTEGYEIEAPGINHPEKLRHFLKHRIGVLQYNETPDPSIRY